MIEANVLKQQSLACVVGARPNFMKMAPILEALGTYPDIRTTLIHTGQHYDPNLSRVFFDQLWMKPPDICLNVGSGTHGEQTARVLERFEAVLRKGDPTGAPYTRVVVVGDVNSTLACALAAVKLGIPVAHVEAGLRSFDRSMPEEINRIVTDSVSDCLLVSEPAGIENLRKEGHDDSHMFLTGNVMIDTLRQQLPKAQALDTLQSNGLEPGEYGVVTLHRPSNVDSPEKLRSLMEVLAKASKDLKLVFPIHPRTIARLEKFGIRSVLDRAKGIIQLPPLGYLPFLALTSEAKVVITDSGGIQEETTALNVPCLTLRRNTERPLTVAEGTSTLVGNDMEKLQIHLTHVLKGTYKRGRCPDLWDGQAAGRIARVLANGTPGHPEIPVPLSETAQPTLSTTPLRNVP